MDQNIKTLQQWINESQRIVFFGDSLTCRTDPTLLGGITLRYGGIQLDDTIRSRLERLRRSLSQTVV